MGPPQYYVPGIPGVDTSTLTGGKSMRRTPTVETSGVGKRRRVQIKTVTDRSSALNVSGTREPDPVYDGHLLANMGPQRLTALSLKIGKRLGKTDGIARFLGNLQQNGKVSTGWNGRILSLLDSRNVTLHMFRHRLSKEQVGDNMLTGNVTNDKYPEDDDGVPYFNVLFPNTTNTSNVYPMNKPMDLVDAATGDKITSPFYTHNSGQTYWCPLNRGDLEDMSWNLNKLKLGSEPFDNTGAVIDLSKTSGKNCALFQIGKHRRQSAIQQNNQKYVEWNAIGPVSNASGGNPTNKSTVAPYVYDAVLRHGVISYDFQNKLDTGAIVELILYRIKKNSLCPGFNSEFRESYKLNNVYMNDPEGGATINPAGPSVTYPLSVLAGSIGRGYVASVADKYSTDDVLGRRPMVSDVFDNPRYPLLPHLSKTKQAQLPFAEVLRNKFTLTAGSRRNVRIELPGDVFDPSMIKTNVQWDPGLDLNTVVNTADPGDPPVYDPVPYVPPETGVEIWPVQAQHIPIIDEHSYCAVISVNGQKMTKFFDNPGVGALGQPGTPASFQVYAAGNTTPYTQFVDLLLMPPSQSFDIGSNLVYVQHTAAEYGTLDNTAVLDIFCSEPVVPGGQTWNNSYKLKVLSISLVKPGYGYNSASTTYYRVSTSLTGNQPIYITTEFLLNGYDGTTGGSTTSESPMSCNFPTFETNQVAEKPFETPMGDAYGTAHVDYTANYTEHIGACMYKNTTEQTLYTQGQPDVPDLVKADGSKTTTNARIILPATTAVRQGDRTSWTLDASGNPSTITHAQGTSTIGNSSSS